MVKVSSLILCQVRFLSLKLSIPSFDTNQIMTLAALSFLSSIHFYWFSPLTEHDWLRKFNKVIGKSNENWISQELFRMPSRHWKAAVATDVANLSRTWNYISQVSRASTTHTLISVYFDTWANRRNEADLVVIFLSSPGGSAPTSLLFKFRN